MPYDSIASLPASTKSLPKHAKEIYMSAFNSGLASTKDEGRAHAIAWAAVKKQYKQEGGRWIAKEAKVETKEAMSANDKREILSAAVIDSLAIGNREHGPWIRDVYDTELVYEIGGKMYRMTYVIDRKGKVTFGQAEKVVPQTVYTPVQEAVEDKIDKLTEAASGREDGYDTSAVTDKLLELLDKDKLTEADAAPALAEADALIVKLSEAAPAKTEDGIAFPRAAYAYTPDAALSSTWKLRLWEDLTKKVTRAQLGRAAAALSPGGFRGQKVAIPSDDMPAVKRKIRAEYRKLGVDDEEIPRWVKEAETREFLSDYTPLTEAKIDKGEANITVIKPGFNSDKSHYYPESTLRRDYGVFEGSKMYADHPSVSEEKDRPERSIRDWVGTLTGVSVQEDGTIVGKAAIVEPWMQEKLAVLRDKDMLDQLGVSINAIGSASTGKIEGSKTKVVERFIRARSVDFVTEPGAGGRVALYEAITDTDVDLVDVEEFKTRRPDIVTLIETEAREKINQEVKKKMEAEDRIKELEGEVDTLTTENTGLKEEKVTAEKEKAKAEAQATIKDAVDKAELPEAAKTRLIEAHKDDESADGFGEIIKSEVAYIAALTETSKVKDLGPSGDPPDKKTHEELVEGFKALGMTDEAAEEAAKGR